MSVYSLSFTLLFWSFFIEKTTFVVAKWYRPRYQSDKRGEILIQWGHWSITISPSQGGYGVESATRTTAGIAGGCA